MIPSSAVSRPLDSSPCHWILWGASIRHKKKRRRFHDLTLLQVGQTVGCLVTQTGELHFFVDGSHVGCGWSGLPVDKPLWGIVDVYGKCSKIKADILSDGMYVHWTYVRMQFAVLPQLGEKKASWLVWCLISGIEKLTRTVFRSENGALFTDTSGSDWGIRHTKDVLATYPPLSKPL